MMYELCHHGIKGMRWGVRRYQNKDGSLTAAGEKRLSRYKEKELDKVTKKYQVDKLSAKLNKLEKKYEDYDDELVNARLNKARYRVLKARGMEFLESTKVGSMTYQDMIDEQTALRKAKSKKFVTGLGRTLVGALIGESSGGLRTDSDTFKTNRRVGLEESIYTDFEVRKITDYRGL